MLPAEGTVSAKPSEPGKISSAGNRGRAGLEGNGKDSGLDSKGNGEPQKGSGQEHKLSMCFSRHL